MGPGFTADHTFTSRVFHFAAELGRRRVWRTAIAYAAVVFVLLQLGEIVFPVFGAPDWALRLLVVTCFLAFPVVVCLAWVFDFTEGGIKKTLGVPHTDDGPLGAGRALPRLALLTITLAIMGGLGWWTVQEAIVGEAPAPVDIGPAMSAAAPTGPVVVRALAVLPLDDFSEEEGGEYFTAGLHEELVSQLSQAEVARVLSRTSVVQYDRSGKTMPAIARDLGVEAVVEGSVFRAGNRVRITVQLIHGPTDTHLWANSYEGTIEDAIALQREVAQAIAGEIRTALSEGRAEVVAAPSVAGNMGRAEEDSSATHAPRETSPARFGVAPRPESPDGVVPPERLISGARRLAAASHFQEAESMLREVAREAGGQASVEAWNALEQIRAIQGDFQGVVELRHDRLARGPSDSRDSVSLAALQALIRERGEAGYWAWKAGDLEGQVGRGKKVSPVEMARACVGVGDLDAAFPHLEAALAEGDRNLVTLWTDPAWDRLRPDPRFRDLLTRVRRSVSGRGFLFPESP